MTGAPFPLDPMPIARSILRAVAGSLDRTAQALQAEPGAVAAETIIASIQENADNLRRVASALGGGLSLQRLAREIETGGGAA
jgi:hypothetical protein